MPNKIDSAITCCLRTNQRPTPAKTFTSENTCKFISDSFILTKKETNFAASNANIAGRNIRIRTNVTEKFSHKRLAEAHNLVITATFRTKIGPPFSTAHRKCCQTIFESLLKSQKFQNTQSDTFMKTQSSFIGT